MYISQHIVNLINGHRPYTPVHVVAYDVRALSDVLSELLDQRLVHAEIKHFIDFVCLLIGGALARHCASF